MLDGTSLIVVLFAAGFLLIAAEVFVPGFIVGTLGFLCLAVSVGLVFYHHGAFVGTIAAIAVSTVSVGGMVIWLNIFPKTFIGRRIVLSRSIASEPPQGSGLVGLSGVAVTDLRPSGMARIGGKRVDVTAVGDFLEEGSAVIVVAADGLRVAVRRKDGLEPAAPDV
jgi:membrane-bound serine protease (ClpP class)